MHVLFLLCFRYTEEHWQILGLRVINTLHPPVVTESLGTTELVHQGDSYVCRKVLVLVEDSCMELVIRIGNS